MKHEALDPRAAPGLLHAPSLVSESLRPSSDACLQRSTLATLLGPGSDLIMVVSTSRVLIESPVVVPGFLWNSGTVGEPKPYACLGTL